MASLVTDNVKMFIEELDGIDLVIDKLLSKSNVSVFEKLCANCESAFNKIADLSVKDIVSEGKTHEVIGALRRFREQLLKLKKYKEDLTSYITQTQGVDQTISNVNQKTQELKDNMGGQTVSNDMSLKLTQMPTSHGEIAA